MGQNNGYPFMSKATIAQKLASEPDFAAQCTRIIESLGLRGEPSGFLRRLARWFREEELAKANSDVVAKAAKFGVGEIKEASPRHIAPPPVKSEKKEAPKPVKEEKPKKSAKKTPAAAARPCDTDNEVEHSGASLEALIFKTCATPSMLKDIAKAAPMFSKEDVRDMVFKLRDAGELKATGRGPGTRYQVK